MLTDKQIDDVMAELWLEACGRVVPQERTGGDRIAFLRQMYKDYREILALPAGSNIRTQRLMAKMAEKVDDREYSFVEIAILLGIHSSSVINVYEFAMKQIKHPEHIKKLRLYMEEK